ncbi:hypothetical protein PFLmoz3_00737 [Pseudomonas fluorescens]|uniref:Uncharacterized protein n=1 Tax=Pseudomonas fluorescens TaxID=294 RepID=A0A120G8Z5_PSEFL|nr:hypothetical protein PFLmoz3_00737 [Pseudomonas fluorescens]
MPQMVKLSWAMLCMRNARRAPRVINWLKPMIASGAECAAR